ARLPVLPRGGDTAMPARALRAAFDVPVEAPAAPEPSAPPVPTPPLRSAGGNPAPAPITAAQTVTTGSEVIELPASRVDEIVRSVGESAASNLRLGRLLGEHLGCDPESVSEYRDLSRSIRHLH